MKQIELKKTEEFCSNKIIETKKNISYFEYPFQHIYR